MSDAKKAPILDLLAEVAATVKADAAAFSKNNAAKDAQGKTVHPKPTEQWLDASVKYELTAATVRVNRALIESVKSML